MIRPINSQVTYETLYILLGDRISSGPLQLIFAFFNSNQETISHIFPNTTVRFVGNWATKRGSRRKSVQVRNGNWYRRQSIRVFKFYIAYPIALVSPLCHCADHTILVRYQAKTDQYHYSCRTSGCTKQILAKKGRPDNSYKLQYNRLFRENKINCENEKKLL
jgi:hypothetical protein